MMRSPIHPTVFLAALWALAPCAQAARPMATDDARIVDAKACQLETWVRRNPDSTQLWAMPACNPTGNLEITFGGAETRADAATTLTDKVFQMKTLVRPLDDDWGWGIAAGTIVHPRQAVSRAWPGDPYAYLPLSIKAAGDSWIVHVNAGVSRDRDAGRTIATWGFGNEVRLRETLYFIGEAFASDRGRPFYQAGLRYWLVKDRVQIDTTYGDRFETASGQRWFTMGLRLLGPPFLP